MHDRALSENVHHYGGEGEKHRDFGNKPLTGRPACPILPEADHIALNRGIDKHCGTYVDPAIEIRRDISTGAAHARQHGFPASRQASTRLIPISLSM
jgi:hypothetical protein